MDRAGAVDDDDDNDGNDVFDSKAAWAELALGGGDFSRFGFSRGGRVGPGPPRSGSGEFGSDKISPAIRDGRKDGGVEVPKARLMAAAAPLGGSSRSDNVPAAILFGGDGADRVTLEARRDDFEGDVSRDATDDAGDR